MTKKEVYTGIMKDYGYWYCQMVIALRQKDNAAASRMFIKCATLLTTVQTLRLLKQDNLTRMDEKLHKVYK